MGELIKSVAENLKLAIEFLEKVKVDKKLKSEKEDVLNRLRGSFKRCSEQCEETYNDVDVNKGSDGDVYNDVGGEQYDDVQVGKQNQEQDNNVYDDNAQDDQNNVYDDNLTDSQNENYDDVETKSIRLIEFEKLSNPVIADYLEQKREKKLLSGAWQKRWCAFHSGILYIYESQKDKQQKDSFDVAGYKFAIRDEITKESKRKERCFELRNDRIKKTYEFCTPDKESLSKWEAAFNLKNTGRTASIMDTNETYDDVGDTGNTNAPPRVDTESKAKKKVLNISSIGLFGKKKPKPSTEKIEEEVDGATYEEYDDVGRNTEEPPPPLEGDEQMYEDYEGDVTSPTRQLPPVPSSLPVPGIGRRSSARDELPPLPSPSPMSPMTPSRDEKTGSGSGSFIRNRPPMPLPGEMIEFPQPPPVQDDFPPQEQLPPPMFETNAPDEDRTSEFDSDDYENLYQGMWDCASDDNNELAFKRGEIVHIISREYESYGWWTAESNDEDVGLVPISYLMRAYDI